MARECDQPQARSFYEDEKVNRESAPGRSSVNSFLGTCLDHQLLLCYLAADGKESKKPRDQALIGRKISVVPGDELDLQL